MGWKELGRVSFPAPIPARSPAWKWWIMLILLMATMINYMDRVTLSNASVRVMDELGLTKKQYGDLEVAFGCAFGIGALVFGFLADRFSVFWLYPLALAGWSLMGVASGLTHGYPALLVCRTLLGLFEAGHWPCALKTTFALLDEKDRTLGNSVLQSGASIGAVITPQLMKVLMTAQPGSWRTAFVIVGAAGMIWIVLWFAFLRPRDLVVTRASVSTGDNRELWAILRGSRFWALAIVIIGIHVIWQLYRAWLTQFLVTGRGYTEAEALNFNSLYFISTDVGCILAGVISLWLIRRWAIDPHRARRLVFTGGCVLTSCSVFIPWLPKGWILLAILLIIGAGALALYPCYYSFVQELSDKHVGRLSGILAMWVWIATSPMHHYYGAYVDRTKSYDMGLLVAGLVPWVSFIALWLLWRPKPAAAPK